MFRDSWPEQRFSENPFRKGEKELQDPEHVSSSFGRRLRIEGIKTTSKKAILSTVIVVVSELLCSLENNFVSRILDEKRRTWFINDTVLQKIGNNLQAIVDCTKAGDVLSFNTQKVIKPSKRIVIPWNLTLTTIDKESAKSNEDRSMFSSTTNFTCPENNGVFFVK